MYGKTDLVSVTDVESLLMVQEAQLDKFKTELTSGTISVNTVQGTNKQDSNY